jgi:hypothetical protein
MGTADRVRHIFSTKGLTLYRVSQRSAELFGQSSHYFIPQRLYFDLATEGLIPSIHQFMALSRISNYRLCDWMALFWISSRRNSTASVNQSINDGAVFYSTQPAYEADE